MVRSRLLKSGSGTGSIMVMQETLLADSPDGLQTFEG